MRSPDPGATRAAITEPGTRDRSPRAERCYAARAMRPIPSSLHPRRPSRRTCARWQRGSPWKLLSFNRFLRRVYFENGVQAHLAERLSIHTDDRDGGGARGQKNRECVAQASSHWNCRTVAADSWCHDVVDCPKSKPLE